MRNVLGDGYLMNLVTFSTVLRLISGVYMLHNSVKRRAPHILIIDDKPEELRSLLNLLRSQEWNISLASDAHSGYQRAVALRPDLIVLDVVMPRMNGFAMCRLLRETTTTRHIPVIFLTSSGLLEERLEGFELGGVDYVIKPFAPQEVCARINLHLRLTMSNQEEGHGVSETSDENILNGDQVILQAAMNYIMENLSAIPSLAGIAQAVGTHEKKLSSIFRHHLGMTVFDYVRQARLRKAQELLTRSTVSIQDIAEMTGFQSACNFTTAFRRAQGVAPGEYRRQAQRIQERV
jgi:DNA-binding response OmpR family regulator